MPQPFENPESQEIRPKGSRLTIGMGVVVVAAILTSLWFLFQPLQNRRPNSIQETIALNMNPVEQEYAKRIEISNIAMSRAENFLHQEVTTLTGELYNGGTQAVLGLALTTEFSDDMHQIVLRDTRKVLANAERALSPGQRRTFEISFEHIPNSWNMQAPSVRIARLQLDLHK